MDDFRCSHENLRELALFAGAGGGILGGALLGWQTVCAVEWDHYAASVLCARQNDGILPPFPIWDDVQTFDGRPWRGIIDVVSGGFPCQDISAAGKGAGINGERSGMWKHMARIVGEVRPRHVFVENSPMLAVRGLDRVIGDLAKIGYDTQWQVMGAADVGAPHQRDRIWIVATDANQHRCGQRSVQSESGKFHKKTNISTNGKKKPLANSAEFRLETERPKQQAARVARICEEMADTNSTRRKKQCREVSNGTQHEAIECGGWWEVEPGLGRVVDGLAARVDRLKAIGNGQVPAVAASVFKLLTIEASK